MMMPSTSLPITAAHRQVDLALRPRIIQQHLASSSAAQQATSSTEVPCHILDAKYEPGLRCSILYQLGKRMVIGELQWREATGDEAQTEDSRRPVGRRSLNKTAAHLGPLAMRVYPFEQDPALPGLVTVLDGQRMAGILNATLPECIAGQASVLRCQTTPLRYRLGKRCTLRFDLWLRDRGGGVLTNRVLYGKLYHSASKAQAVYDEMQMLAETSLRTRGVVVAQTVAFAPELPMVFQSPVAGIPLDLLLSQPKRTVLAHSPRVLAGIRGAAVALAALHEIRTGSSRSRPVADELERLKHRSAQIVGVSPKLGADLSKLAQALPAWLDRLPAWGAEASLVHGDCKPSQFFIMPELQDECDMSFPLGAVALLDFDHCGIADPASDVGNFLATLRQQAIRQALKQRQPDMQRLTGLRPPIKHSAPGQDLQWGVAARERLFLTEYLATRRCHPGLRLRATWYQAMALLRKALRSFARSPRSPLPALLVEEAWRCLSSEGMAEC